MAYTEQSASEARKNDGSARSALAQAAEDLEAVTSAYDECTDTLEAVEATVDALLDDPTALVLVLDEQRRVAATSRGMADVVGQDAAVLGRAVADVVPTPWRVLDPAVRDLGAEDGWRSLSLPDDEGALSVRRVTEDDREAVYLVRYEPPGT